MLGSASVELFGDGTSTTSGSDSENPDEGGNSGEAPDPAD